MNKLLTTLISVLLIASVVVLAQEKKGNAEFDVLNYKIEADLNPAEQKLRGRAEVTLVPQTETRSVVFEMNGSLTITKVTMKSGAPMATAPVITTTAPPKPATPAGQRKTVTPATKIAPAPVPATTAPGNLQFIQDSRESMNVRVDLGGVVQAKSTITLVFEYEGALESAQGGT